jgi:cytochrome c peroxidase
MLALSVIGCSTDLPITKAQLGNQVFNDPDLSNPPGQACADCHTARVAYRDPETDNSTSMGAVDGRFGLRNSPTAMYARFIPPLHLDADQHWVGGLFWDGRADSLEDQASGPLLNPLEMNHTDKASVVEVVRGARYAPLFREIYGPHALDDVDNAYAHVTEVIAELERTTSFSPFSSKYDHYLAGAAKLTEPELRGLAIFENPARGNCAGCHPSRPSADGTPPMFTDFRYANLGIPRYENNKFFVQPKPWNPDGDRFIDHGLMTTVKDPAEDGKFRTPTLRNIALTPPYGHNGYFENLPYMLDFLNSRDVGSTAVGTCTRVKPSARCAWPGPEVRDTIDHSIGHLGLSEAELDDLLAFLSTLSDQEPELQ